MTALIYDSKNRYRVKFCPCGDVNSKGHFVPFIGYTDRGYCHKCTKMFTPDSEQQKQHITKDTYKTVYNISCYNGFINVGDVKLFTEIDRNTNNASSIIKYYSLKELADKLNELNPTSYSKHNAPAILKGIYAGGISGQHCTQPAPILFYDIDIKENPDLKNNEVNNIVFEYLKTISLLVWRSNSGLGIAGALFAPQLAEIDHSNTQMHLSTANSIYTFLAQMLLTNTAIDVSFDWQQGKFRQVRYLAPQAEPRNINNKPLLFNFTATQVNERHIPPSTIKKWILNASMASYENNNFVKFLYKNFEAKEVSEVLKAYNVGSSKHWHGATVFWQVDAENKIRTGKIILYDAATGRRKDNFQFVHAALKLFDYNLKQCFFGEHLLNLPQNINKTVAVVESEKTAIIANLVFNKVVTDSQQHFVWLAASGKSGLTADKCKVLKNRNVVLYPDLNAVEHWQQLATRYNFKVSALLTRYATNADISSGLDVADFLLKHLPKLSTPKPEPTNKAVKYINGITYCQQTQTILCADNYPAEWDLIGNTIDAQTKEALQAIVREFNQNNEFLRLQNN